MKHASIKRALFVALVVAALPLAAQADDLKYSFLQGGYQATDFDGLPNAHGWGASASGALGSNFQVFGGWARQDFNNSNASYDDWNLGAGFHTPINASTDFVTNVDYRRLNFHGDGGDMKVYSGEAGVRSALAPHFEGWVLAGYEDGHNIDGAVYGKLGGQYTFGKGESGRGWGLVGEAKFSKDMNTYFIGPRFTF